MRKRVLKSIFYPNRNTFKFKDLKTDSFDTLKAVELRKKEREMIQLSVNFILAPISTQWVELFFSSSVLTKLCLAKKRLLLAWLICRGVLVFPSFLSRRCSLQQINIGREPWSSGYGRGLIFWRSWVRIPAPYTGCTFFRYICCKNCNVCLEGRK